MSHKKPADTITKPVKRISLVALIFSAIVFGFIAGLGGSLLLSHSLIQRPLQEQQANIAQQNLVHRQRLAELEQTIVAQDEQILLLRDKIEYLIEADSTGYLKELASIQKENRDREQLFLQQLAQVQQQTSRIENSIEEFSKSVDEAKKELDREDKALRDDIRSLRSALNDIKNKLQQIERQFAAR